MQRGMHIIIAHRKLEKKVGINIHRDYIGGNNKYYAYLTLVSRGVRGWGYTDLFTGNQLPTFLTFLYHPLLHVPSLPLLEHYLPCLLKTAYYIYSTHMYLQIGTSAVAFSLLPRHWKATWRYVLRYRTSQASSSAAAAASKRETSEKNKRAQAHKLFTLTVLYTKHTHVCREPCVFILLGLINLRQFYKGRLEKKRKKKGFVLEPTLLSLPSTTYLLGSN